MMNLLDSIVCLVCEEVCVLVAGYFVYLAYLAIYFGTKIFCRLVRILEPPLKSRVEMPILRPIAIPSKQRNRLSRFIVWMHQVRHWEIVENWKFFLPDGTEIVIHRGFIFDGGSVPRPFWWLLSPTGLILIQSLIHDYAYRYNQLWQVQNGQVTPYMEGAGRSFWDDLFRQIGRDVNGMSGANFMAWLAESLFGGISWRKNRGRNEQITIPEGMALHDGPANVP